MSITHTLMAMSMMTNLIRYGACAGALVVVAALAPNSEPRAAGAPAPGDRLGFVVTDLAYVLASDDNASIACPDGFSLSPRAVLEARPGAARTEGETEQAYFQRMQSAARELTSAPDGRNLCMNPEAGAPDPNHRTVTGSPLLPGGVDLDRTDSANVCRHNEFRGADGVSGIDNQFYRAVGCLASFQATGSSNSFAQEMLTGSWGVLITLEGVDDLRNDDDVRVGIYANDDPIEVSASRAPLRDATYTIQADERFQTETRGRIRDGVLTTEPADVRMHWIVNAMYLERHLRDARLQVTLQEDGAMDGYLAGYSPVEEIYDTVFGFRNGRDANGELASLRRRQGSSTGYALTAGHTCNGVYHAFKQLADGHRDAQTGECTSISTQYRISALPAFVVASEPQEADALSQ